MLAILIGTGLTAAFVRRQLRLADPLIDLRLFRAPAFSTSLIVYMLGTFVAFGVFVFMTQYLLLVLEMAPLEQGCGPYRSRSASSPDRWWRRVSRACARPTSWRAG